MKKTRLAGVLLIVVLTHPALAESDGQRIARVCAVDFQRLCAGRVPIPAIEDFREGGRIYNCLEQHLASGQLSQDCH